MDFLYSLTAFASVYCQLSICLDLVAVSCRRPRVAEYACSLAPSSRARPSQHLVRSVSQSRELTDVERTCIAQRDVLSEVTTKCNSEQELVLNKQI